MGSFVSIRGWLECDYSQIESVQEITLAHDDYYSGGWGVPGKQYNGAFMFYAASIREQSLDWFMDQLRELAEIPLSAYQDDADRICGYFLVSHEVNGMSELQVRDGQVFVLPADARLRYLDD
jgi:hypothetical protein